MAESRLESEVARLLGTESPTLRAALSQCRDGRYRRRTHSEEEFGEFVEAWTDLCTVIKDIQRSPSSRNRLRHQVADAQALLKDGSSWLASCVPRASISGRGLQVGRLLENFENCYECLDLIMPMKLTATDLESQFAGGIYEEDVGFPPSLESHSSRLHAAEDYIHESRSNYTIGRQPVRQALPRPPFYSDDEYIPPRSTHYAVNDDPYASSVPLYYTRSEEPRYQPAYPAEDVYYAQPMHPSSMPNYGDVYAPPRRSTAPAGERSHKSHRRRRRHDDDDRY
jgi:hypothetical protein